jgi:hypothetical protein
MTSGAPRVPLRFWKYIAPTPGATLVKLAEAGISAIPMLCDAKSKRPAIAGWKKYQSEPPTSDEANDWLAAGGFNAVALVTGPVSGWVMVDADDADANKWIEDNLPPTPVQQRTRRGRHYFYRQGTEQIGTGTGAGNGHVDWRGSGGLALIEPSPDKKLEVTGNPTPGDIPTLDAHTHLLVPAGRATPATGHAATDSPIKRNAATGKITDGRESYLTKQTYAIFCDLFEKRERDPTADELAVAVWQDFEAACDNSDGKYTEAMAQQRASYLLERVRKGEVTRPQIYPDRDCAPTSPPVSADAASAILKAQIEDYIRMRDGRSRILLRSPPGLGKTTSTIDLATAYIDSMRGKDAFSAPMQDWAKPMAQTTFVVRSHKLAAEVGQRLDAANGSTGSAVIIVGRDRDVGGNPVCDYASQAKQITDVGYSVFASLCLQSGSGGDVRCPSFDSCEYNRRLRAARESPTPIALHAHLSTLRRLGVYDADVDDEGVPQHPRWKMFTLDDPAHIVCDEDPTANLVDTDTQYPEKALGQLVNRLLRETILTGKSGGLLDLLRDAGFTPERLIELTEAQAKHDYAAAPGLAPGSTNNAAKLPKLKKRYRWVGAIKRLAAELASGRKGDSYSLGFATDKQGAPIIRLFGRRNWPDGASALILDGTASPTILRTVIPGLKALDEIIVQRNAEVIQVRDRTFSEYSLLGKQSDEAEAADDDVTEAATAGLLEEVRRVIEREAEQGKTLVVATKKVRLALTNEAEEEMPASSPAHGADIAHYGNIRGTNDFEGHDTIILLGRMELPVVAAEDRAKAIWFDATTPLKFIPTDSGGARRYQNERRRYWMPKLGERAPIGKASCHPDPRVQAVVESLWEAEMLQSIDRLRLLHSTKRKRVIVLCNISIPGLAVDRLLSWADVVRGNTRLEAALRQSEGDGHDMLPLSPKWLAANFRGLWTERQAEDDTTLRDNPAAEYERAVLGMDISAYEFRKYRQINAKKPSSAMLRRGTDGNAAISKRLGADFELLPAALASTDDTV